MCIFKNKPKLYDIFKQRITCADGSAEGESILQFKEEMKICSSNNNNKLCMHKVQNENSQSVDGL